MQYLNDTTLREYLRFMGKSSKDLRAAYRGRRKTLTALNTLWNSGIEGKTQIMETVAGLPTIGHDELFGI